MSWRARWVVVVAAAAGLVAMAAALLAAAAAFRFGSVLILIASLAFPTAASFAPFSRGVTIEEVSVPAGDHPLAADLYRPVRSDGALLLVHGLSRAGRRQPDLERLARLLADRGQLVLVPHFPGMAVFRLRGGEVAEVRAAIDYLARPDRRVGVAGLSFGAGPALLAAADRPDVHVVVSFGGYADLGAVITFVTTGAHGWAGHRYVQRQQEYNRWKLLAALLAAVEDRRDAAALSAIADRRLADPADDTAALESDLGAEGRAVLALVLNRREEAVAPLLEALPARARAALAALSPLGAIPRIHGRLLIAHGAWDDSIPYTESLRLAAAASRAPRLLILRGFHHTGPRSAWAALAGGVGDGWGLVRLVDDALSRR